MNDIISVALFLFVAMIVIAIFLFRRSRRSKIIGLCIMAGVIGISLMFKGAHNDPSNKYYCFAENRYLPESEIKQKAMEHWMIAEDDAVTPKITKFVETYIAGNPECCGVRIMHHKFRSVYTPDDYANLRKPLAARLHMKTLFGVKENTLAMPSVGASLTLYNNSWGGAFSVDLSEKQTDEPDMRVVMNACATEIQAFSPRNY